MRRSLVLSFFAALALRIFAQGPEPSGYRPAFIDRSISPCDNFYKFALGTWLKEAPNLIRPDQASIGYDKDLLARQEPVLRAILTEKTEPRTPEARLVRTFYRSVLKGPRGEGIAPIQPLLDRIKRARTLKESAALLGWLHQSDIQTLWVWRVRPGDQNPGMSWLRLENVWTAIPGSSSYTGESDETIALRKAYSAHLEGVLKLAGVNPAEAQARGKDILALEVRLVKERSATQDTVASIKANPLLTLKDLESKFPVFPWREYFKGLGLPHPGHVMVQQPKAIEAAVQWMIQASPDQRQAYFSACLLKALAPFLDAPVRAAHDAFWATRLVGRTGVTEPEREALDLTRDMLGMPLGREYVRRTFTEETRRGVQTLVEDLRQALYRRIEASTWLSAEVKKIQLEKVRTFSVEIGHPQRWPSLNGLQIQTQRPLVLNVLSIMEHTAHRHLGHAGKPTDPDDWFFFDPLPPSAMGDPLRCRVVLPAGIIQPPYFHPKASYAANYGGLGCVLGHEIGHLFDETGPHYDAQGRLTEGWSPEDDRAYQEQADKLSAQVDAYEVLPGLHADGKETLGEALPDQLGVEMSFDAFQHRSLGLKAEADANGFTPEQQFFLSYAESYRFWQREETLRERMRRENHPPVEFCVNGPLANLEGFHRAFGCGTGSAMYRPEHLRPKF